MLYQPTFYQSLDGCPHDPTVCDEMALKKYTDPENGLDPFAKITCTPDYLPIQTHMLPLPLPLSEMTDLLAFHLLRNLLMDKSWIHEPRLSLAYEVGVALFLDFAFSNESERGGRVIRCPCMKCYNIYFGSRDVVYEHLICNGLDICYFRNIWRSHGELDRSSNEMLYGDKHDQQDSQVRLPQVSSLEEIQRADEKLSEMKQQLNEWDRKLQNVGGLSEIKQQLNEWGQRLQNVGQQLDRLRTTFESRSSSILVSDIKKTQPPNDS